jgi:hypothetical protein
MDKPILPDVAAKLREYRKREGCYVGGGVHIVVDDNNYEQHHAYWCLKRAQDEGDEHDIEIATLINAMSNRQRRRLFALDTYPDR